MKTGFENKEELKQIFAGIEPAFKVADGKKFIIAGPCSAESCEQVVETAIGVKKAGANVLRAGIWKPRTRPGCFEGIGAPGLMWLQEARRVTGLPVTTEVATPAHVEAALAAGVDILWIGARTTVNPFSVQAIADALRGCDVPVMVKNPANPDIELWIGAMQRLYNAGIRKITAIHRGFSSYGSTVYRNPPQWQLPIELHRRMPDLQMICDPSHISGKRDLVAPLAHQAYELGFNGLMIETHRCPCEALSDASQQLTPAELKALLASLVEQKGSTTSADLASLRSRIDNIDDELLVLLSKRMTLSDEVGKIKVANNMQVLQPERYETLMESRVGKAVELGLDRDFISALLSAIHAESVNRQLKLK
jgi:chorismate mutase